MSSPYRTVHNAIPPCSCCCCCKVCDGVSKTSCMPDVVMLKIHDITVPPPRYGAPCYCAFGGDLTWFDNMEYKYVSGHTCQGTAPMGCPDGIHDWGGITEAQPERCYWVCGTGDCSNPPIYLDQWAGNCGNPNYPNPTPPDGCGTYCNDNYLRVGCTVCWFPNFGLRCNYSVNTSHNCNLPGCRTGFNVWGTLSQTDCWGPNVNFDSYFGPPCCTVTDPTSAYYGSNVTTDGPVCDPELGFISQTWTFSTGCGFTGKLTAYVP